jgi:hypothetical protein
MECSLTLFGSLHKVPSSLHKWKRKEWVFLAMQACISQRCCFCSPSCPPVRLHALRCHPSSRRCPSVAPPRLHPYPSTFRVRTYGTHPHGRRLGEGGRSSASAMRERAKGEHRGRHRRTCSAAPPSASTRWGATQDGGS